MRKKYFKMTLLFLISIFCFRKLLGVNEYFNSFNFEVLEKITNNNMMMYFQLSLFWFLPYLLIYIDLFGSIDTTIDKLSPYFVLRYSSNKMFFNMILNESLIKSILNLTVLYLSSIIIGFQNISALNMLITLSRVYLVIIIYILIRILIKKHGFMNSFILLVIMISIFYTAVSNNQLVSQFLLLSNSLWVLLINCIMLIVGILTMGVLSKRMEY